MIGTSPYDGAPGGYRNSMQQMADVPAPYGDIIALHDNHCFIPTVSALDLDTSDLFYDVADDPDPLALSPFDALYFPAVNEEHVFITPQNKAWLLEEIEETPADAPGADSIQPMLTLSTFPNPVEGTARVRFFLPDAGTATLGIFDASGRQVALLADGAYSAGMHELEWRTPSRAAGVYFVRLRGEGFAQSAQIVVR